jgi:hypothetical protein
MLNSVTRYGDNLLDFYNLPKSVLCRMAGNHFVTSHQGSSGFSSWAASLHLVLSYAKFLKKHNRGEPHAAVMDTHDLADEVYVWHAPHIVCETHGTLEYIAFGRIMGNGYRAVSLTVSEDHGIDFLFPRVRNGRHTKFGGEVRERIFRAPAITISPAGLGAIMVVESPFCNLSIHVTTALACLRPRIWRDWRKPGG